MTVVTVLFREVDRFRDERSVLLEAPDLFSTPLVRAENTPPYQHFLEKKKSNPGCEKAGRELRWCSNDLSPAGYCSGRNYD